MRKFFPFLCFIFLTVSCGQKTCSGNTSGTNDKIAVKGVQTTVTDSMPAEESDESVKRFTIFKKSGKEMYIERDSLWSMHCYTVKNGVKRKMVFNHEYLDDGACEFSYYSYGKYLYIVGDFKPNSNGWTCRYPVYRIDTDDFTMKYVYAGAAIRFTPKEIVIADARLTNKEAECTADEVWVMHDIHFDVNGNKIREDKKEYDYEEMERRYGNELVNTFGLEE